MNFVESVGHTHKKRRRAHGFARKNLDPGRFLSRAKRKGLLSHADDLCIYNWLFVLIIIPTERWALQCTMSRAEGAAFTCSWRDRLTGRETLWGNKGVPKTKEGHNQSQIPLRTSLPPIGAESPGVQVALSTNSVSVSRSLKLFWSVPINKWQPMDR